MPHWLTGSIPIRQATSQQRQSHQLTISFNDTATYKRASQHAINTDTATNHRIVASSAGENSTRSDGCMPPNNEPAKSALFVLDFHVGKQKKIKIEQL